MGLDAVVYRNRKHLQLGPDEETAQLIPDTGQVYFDNDETSRRHYDQLKAADIRLGNISKIAELRDEMIQLAGTTNMLYQKVLYSGSHSGDFVPLDELRLMLDEIRSVRRTGKPSKELRRFLDQMEELIRTATNESNPIVFV